MYILINPNKNSVIMEKPTGNTVSKRIYKPFYCYVTNFLIMEEKLDSDKINYYSFYDDETMIIVPKNVCEVIPENSVNTNFYVFTCQTRKFSF